MANNCAVFWCNRWQVFCRARNINEGIDYNDITRKAFKLLNAPQALKQFANKLQEFWEK